jgi:glycosyltransferase involved in cell wall biosynthesis
MSRRTMSQQDPSCYRVAVNERPKLSVVIPLHNEEATVPALLAELFTALGELGLTHEVICVDDGSRDGTFTALRAEAHARPALRVIRFRVNFGQTAALSAGLEAALGEVIVPMDGDLQNDPADIGRMLARLEEGHDVVSGWRKERRDPELGRKLASRVANGLISAISGVRLHDYGCSLKAYRREVLEDVRLYGEMHRLVPIYARRQGARVTELVVNHRARRAGRSHYGFARTFKVLLDLMVVMFLTRFASKPVYVFGGAGLVALAAAGAALLAWVYRVLAGSGGVALTLLPVVTVMFTVAGALSLLMGLLAELVMRTYYEAQGRRPYVVAEELNRPGDVGRPVEMADVRHRR